ncbi:MAG: pyruvate kinase [Candidatus Andersenbacteria bacterium]|nr:pyruvate kinase [Candidatus Andersenbacteria bacterium]
MHKRTNIVCTIGPASSMVPVLKEMIVSGMNVARINFSHGDHDANLHLVDTVRTASQEVGMPVAILQDLQGPKLRVGVLPNDGMELIEGKLVRLQAGVLEAEKGVIPVPYDRFAHDLGKSDRILLADGTRELEVVDVQGNMITAKVLLGGKLISHKGINVPTVTLSLESMTEKDDLDLAFGLKQNIDFVALSFVRSAEDVRQLKEKIGKWLPENMEPPHIIVKIEKHEALINFDEILEEADGVMIARGDLGLETPVAKLPIHQKELIVKCIAAGKPVITATEMMASMEFNPRPTRAEVSDVANAVIDHTDAAMLSGESAMGKYPIQAVRMMSDIIEQTEESSLDDIPANSSMLIDDSIASAVASSAVALARSIKADAILVTTGSGYSARHIARLRPEVPVFAATQSPRVFNQLILSWGITPILIDGYNKPDQMVVDAVQYLQEKEGFTAGAKLVIMSGLKKESGKDFESTIRVREI